LSNENNQEISWYAQSLRKFRIWAHRISPNLILHPNETSLLDYREKDDEENLESQLPEGEVLTVAAIWAVEVYGPSEIDSLYKNLTRLGWDRSRIGDRHNALDWINEQRMYGSVGNFNVGVVTRKGDNQFLVSNRIFAVLPPEVDYLLVYLYQLSASLTCLRIGFVIKDGFDNRYRDVIERKHKTQRVVQGKGRIYYEGIVNSKIKEISRMRIEYRKFAADWIKKELPGFFCRAQDGNRIPTAELIFTDKEFLFGKDEPNSGRSHFCWRMIVVNAAHEGQWTAEGFEGLQMAMDKCHGNERYHTVIALKTSSVSAENMKCRGEPNKSAYVSLCEDYFGGALVYMAGLAFLREIGRSIKVAREELQLNTKKFYVLPKLEIIENFISDSIGKPSIASELRAEANRDSAFRHWCENFTMTHWPRPEILSLPKVFAQRTVYFADKFIAEEATAREQFEQLSSILNTRESIKTQSRMEKWTLVAIFLALASLFAALLALAPIAEWPTKIIEFVTYIKTKIQTK
jgi:hypothetical protein